MPKEKINSINGRQRSHSILRGLIPLINGLCQNTPIKDARNIGIGKLAYGTFNFSEPIEVREFRCEGKMHYIRIKAYCDDGFQALYLRCHKDKFPQIMNYIVQYCDNHRPKNSRNQT